MSIHFGNLAAQVAQDGTVTAEEIAEMRRLAWGDGVIHPDEAEALFEINRQVTGQSPEWVDFFVEALAEYTVNGTEPRGYVDDAKSDWLIASIDSDGKLETMAELELLVRVVEKAQNVPERLKKYALEQVEQAVLTGNGPTRCGGELSDSHISDAEVKLIRRLVYSAGGDGPAAVSRFDAEMLFRLKDKSLGAANSAEWKDMFVKGIGNYLMGFTRPNAQLSQARMRELEAFMADTKPNVGRVIGGMFREMPNARNHFGKVFGKKPVAMNEFARMAAGEEITSDERNWLDFQIDADGQVDEFERALLDFLAQELPKQR